MVELNYISGIETIHWLDDLGNWLPPLIAVLIAAWLSFKQFERRQRQKNEHVLHALWKESELVYIDCKNWQDAAATPILLNKIKKSKDFQPVSINYKTLQSTIDTIIHNMPGIGEKLVHSAIGFHYADTSAAAMTEFIGSDKWRDLSQEQKAQIIKYADIEVATLLKACETFHILLSEELLVQPSPAIKPESASPWKFLNKNSG